MLEDLHNFRRLIDQLQIMERKFIARWDKVFGIHIFWVAVGEVSIAAWGGALQVSVGGITIGSFIMRPGGVLPMTLKNVLEQVNPLYPNDTCYDRIARTKRS